MRILVLASTYPRWPADTLPPFVHELASRLARQHEVHVLAPHAMGCKSREVMDGVQVRRFRYGPARFETLAYSSGMLPGLRRRPWRLLGLPIFLCAEWLTTLRLLRQQRFDVIHAHWLLPHGLIALMARALCGYHPALISTSHGADLYGLRGAFARMLKRYVVRHSDHVAVVSQAMCDDLREETGGTSNVSVLPMGVDTRVRFVPPAAPNTRSGLLFVGRLADKKGVSVLLDAMAKLKGVTRVSLHIIGSGPEEDRLKRQAEALSLQGLVDFVGPVPNQDLPRWFQRAAVLVFPSVVTPYGDQEGLGLVPIEALACGCAVVASDLPAVRDVIRHEVTGLMVKPGDPDALAAALRHMLEDSGLRARFAAAGRDAARARFDWEHVAEQYSSRFRALLGETQHR